MRFNDLLEEVFGSKSKIKILRVMLRTKVPLTGRKIAVLSGLNHRTGLLSLRELIQEGFVAVRSAGKSKIYTLNADNVFLKAAVSRLFFDEKNLLSTLFRRIRAGLKGKVSALILFGSIAEGREAPDSDIDICVVIGPREKRAAAEKILKGENERVLTEYGNELAPYYVTKDDFIKKYKKGDKLIRDIADKGRFIIGGRFF